MNWSNRFVAWMLRSPIQFLIPGTMLIEIRGRKSGKPLAVPVNYLRESNLLYTVSLRNRTWWRNLIGGAPVTVCVQGSKFDAVAEAVTDPNAVAEGLRKMIQLAPSTARYYRVQINARGEPNGEELGRAAESRVIVRTRLN